MPVADLLSGGGEVDEGAVHGIVKGFHDGGGQFVAQSFPLSRFGVVAEQGNIAADRFEEVAVVERVQSGILFDNVQQGAPLVEIPDVGAAGHAAEPGIAVPVRDGVLQQLFRHRPVFGEERGVAAVEVILPCRGDPCQRKNRDGDGNVHGGAETEETVVPAAEAVGEKLITGPGEVVVAPEVIAVQSLIARIVGVHGLFPPRAVLIMLVHAELEGADAVLPQFEAQAVAAPESGRLRERIFPGTDAAGGDFHRHAFSGRGDVQLDVTASDAVKDQFVPVQALFADVFVGEAPGFDFGADVSVVQMFAVTAVHPGPGGRGQLEEEESRLFASEVVYGEYPVVVSGILRHIQSEKPFRPADPERR